MKPYYYIYSPTKEAPTRRHLTEESAIIEAERLATNNPGINFEILKCIAISCVRKPVNTFFLDED